MKYIFEIIHFFCFSYAISSLVIFPLRLLSFYHTMLLHSVGLLVAIKSPSRNFLCSFSSWIASVATSFLPYVLATSIWPFKLAVLWAIACCICNAGIEWYDTSLNEVFKPPVNAMYLLGVAGGVLAETILLYNLECISYIKISNL